MPTYFCTLFDRNYLFKGIAMLESLVAHCPDAQLFVLCMDNTTFDYLGMLAYKHVVRIRLADVEGEELLAVKPGRTVAEYCWTLGPSLTWHVFQTRREVQQLTYVDADLYFFSSVRPLFEEMGPASIAIIEHRLIPRLAEYAVNGRFNVEWLSFRRDEQGMACLSRWRDQCIEWCFHRLENGRMGDQKYLDAWPKTYSSLRILQHPGAGVAPWNYANYKIQTGASGITIDGAPLIFYHFHQMQMCANGMFHYMSNLYTVEKPPPSEIYKVYEAALSAAVRKVQSHDPEFRHGFRPLLPLLLHRFVQTYAPRGVKQFVRQIVSRI